MPDRASGCNCCGVTPAECLFLAPSFTTGGGSPSFNTTDWSCDVTPNVISAGVIEITDGVLTPLFSMPNADAYYVQVTIVESVSSGAVVKIKQGSNSIELDIDDRDLDVNSVNRITAVPVSTKSGSLEFYICPDHVHGMATVNSNWGSLVAGSELSSLAVDESVTPTVNNNWTIEVEGTAQLRFASYQSGDVVYDGSTKISDCRPFWFACRPNDFYSVVGAEFVPNISVANDPFSLSPPNIGKTWTFPPPFTFSPGSFPDNHAAGQITGGGGPNACVTGSDVGAHRSDRYQYSPSPGGTSLAFSPELFFYLTVYFGRPPATQSVPYPPATGAIALRIVGGGDEELETFYLANELSVTSWSAAIDLLTGTYTWSYP